MRQCERARVIAPPDELREIAASLPYSPDEIDRAFELLVSPDGKTIGGSLTLGALDDQSIARLLIEDLVAIEADGARKLSKKGKELVALLSEYADARHRWTSLVIGSGRELKPVAIALYRELLLTVWSEAAQSWHEQLTDQYRLGVVQGVEQALATIDHVFEKFGVNPREVRGLFAAEEIGRG